MPRDWARSKDGEQTSCITVSSFFTRSLPGAGCVWHVWGRKLASTCLGHSLDATLLRRAPHFSLSLSLPASPPSPHVSSATRVNSVLVEGKTGSHALQPQHFFCRPPRLPRRRWRGCCVHRFSCVGRRGPQALAPRPQGPCRRPCARPHHHHHHAAGCHQGGSARAAGRGSAGGGRRAAPRRPCRAARPQGRAQAASHARRDGRRPGRRRPDRPGRPLAVRRLPRGRRRRSRGGHPAARLGVRGGGRGRRAGGGGRRGGRDHHRRRRPGLRRRSGPGPGCGCHGGLRGGRMPGRHCPGGAGAGGGGGGGAPPPPRPNPPPPSGRAG